MTASPTRRHYFRVPHGLCSKVVLCFLSAQGFWISAACAPRPYSISVFYLIVTSLPKYSSWCLLYDGYAIWRLCDGYCWKALCMLICISLMIITWSRNTVIIFAEPGEVNWLAQGNSQGTGLMFESRHWASELMLLNHQSVKIYHVFMELDWGQIQEADGTWHSNPPSPATVGLATESAAPSVPCGPGSLDAHYWFFRSVQVWLTSVSGESCFPHTLF